MVCLAALGPAAVVLTALEPILHKDYIVTRLFLLHDVHHKFGHSGPSLTLYKLRKSGMENGYLQHQLHPSEMQYQKGWCQQLNKQWQRITPHIWSRHIWSDQIWLAIFGPTQIWSGQIWSNPLLVQPIFGPAKFGRTQIWSNHLSC